MFIYITQVNKHQWFTVLGEQWSSLFMSDVLSCNDIFCCFVSFSLFRDLTSVSNAFSMSATMGYYSAPMLGSFPLQSLHTVRPLMHLYNIWSCSCVRHTKSTQMDIRSKNAWKGVSLQLTGDSLEVSTR